MKAFIPYLFCVILGFVLAMFFKGCGNSKPCPCDGKIISTIVKHDTIKVPVSDTTSGWQKPGQVDPLEGGDINKAIRTGQYRENSKVVNIPSMASDYFIDTTFDSSSHLYESNYHFKQGDIKVQTISKCPIDSQRISLSNFQKEIITTTSTIKELVTEPKRNEMYLGISAMGNIAMPFYAFGPSLSFKTKTDRVLEAGVLYTRSNSIMYQFGIKLKISFRKN